MDSSTKSRKSLKKHAQGTRFVYGIDMKEKFKIYVTHPRLPGELCVRFDLQLKLLVGNPELNISVRSHAI